MLTCSTVVARIGLPYFLSRKISCLSSKEVIHFSITKAYLRPDEAGCYHNSSLLASLRDIGSRQGIEIVRYDYSEPQYGKHMCNRILCPMKAAVRRYS